MLHDCNAIQYALTLLESNEMIGAAYFSHENTRKLAYTLIDKNNFNGFNGLWNTCSLIKIDLLKRRQFRREVFIAEDQEWARWLLCSENKVIARIAGAGMDNSQNNNRKLRGRTKRLNEYVAVAYFANRDLLRFRHLGFIAYQVIKPIPRLQLKGLGLRERIFNLILLYHLLRCHFVRPKYKSRYF